MLPRCTFCVHGNAFSSEQSIAHPTTGTNGPGDFVLVMDTGVPRGWGREFTIGGWFHVTPPTPIGWNGGPVYLDEIIVFRSDGCTLNDVHMWVNDRLFWTGGPTFDLQGSWVFRPVSAQGERFHINGGLGISLNITIPERQKIIFNSALASFSG